MTEIVDTADMPEGEFEENLSATTESNPAEKIEFFVQMRGYTAREVDALIVEAAARQIIGQNGDSKLAKQIEARCIELTAEKVDAKLWAVTKDIIQQPMIPAFGSSKEPVTIAEFMGLAGREYLSEWVDHQGKPTSKDAWGRNGGRPRMQYLVMKAMEASFESEIKAATAAAVREVQAAIRAEHVALLEAEKERLRKALEKATT